MWFFIWYMFYLMQCAIGVLDMFTFASAPTTFTETTKTNTTETFQTPNLSTAKTYMYRRTAFENLMYWTGDPFKPSTRKACLIRKDCKKNRRRMGHVHTHLKKRYDTRRNRDAVFDSRSHEEKERSTRYVLMDIEHTSHAPEESSVEKVLRNTKINGYTLQSEMLTIMSMLSKANTSVSVIARSIEVHDIVLCRITKKRDRSKKIFRADSERYENEQPKKKIILIVHGLTSMGFRDVPCLYKKESLLKLVKMYAAHLNQFDIFLVPMANPDGIADETLIMWNKNKSPQSECAGVALDRNFDVHWNNSNGFHSCSQQYPGRMPFSENESRAVADLIHYYSDRIAAYIHVHGGTYNQRSFKGDAVLFPKGYDDESTEDQYNDVHTAIEEAMRNAGFKHYALTVTSLYNWYGRVTGTSVDYATTVYGIPFGLEFVMQSYLDHTTTKTTSEEMQDNVLNEVWKRVIDVVFDVIFKSTEPVHDD